MSLRVCAALVVSACAVLLALLALVPGVGLAAEEEAGPPSHALDGPATYRGTMEAWSAAPSVATAQSFLLDENIDLHAEKSPR